MLATVTSKGQVTLPKAIRDHLKIEAGTQLDFQLNGDGSISARPLKRSALSIVGLLHRPGRSAVTVDQMNDAIAEGATARHQRSTKSK